ncbi:hypothetical protein M3Y97_00186000 [Aphelenchoides bicaudatus]|nr:hypothetical protein M3Y97_00186000 [Aphelenchoides bicaudatus]
MTAHKESYYRCCCGVHVHTFTFIVAVLVILFWSICAAGIILYGEYFALLICIPPLFSYGSLLIGNRCSLPGNYCPFLIVNLALSIGAFLFAGIFYLTGSAFISHNFRIGSDGLETFLGSVTVLVGTGAAICAFCQFYYFYIVYRDYEYVKNRVSEAQNIKKPTKPTRQRRFYVDPKKLPKFCPCHKKATKKQSIKVEESEESDNGEHLNPTFRDGIPDEYDPLLFPPMNSWRSASGLNRSWAPAKKRLDKEYSLNRKGSLWQITSV